MKRFLAILHARNLEFMRDRSALAWGFIFPTVLMLVFALIYSNEQQNLYKVGVIGKADHPFLSSQYIQFIPMTNMNDAIIKVERHQIDLLINPEDTKYWVNTESPSGYITEQLLKASGGNSLKASAVSGKQIRYIDWLIPGVLSMNMMFSALFGIGFVIVRYRKNGVLKRLRGTPLSATEFLLAQIFSRLLLILMVSVTVYIVCDLILDFTMNGSYFTLLLVFSVGALSMIALGLLIAARLTSDEVASGIANAISIPLMLLSGVWFSLEGSPQWLIEVANLLPLTHVVSASRAVMLDGASLLDVSHHLVIMLIMMIVCLLVGVKMFRWE